MKLSDFLFLSFIVPDSLMSLKVSLNFLQCLDFALPPKHSRFKNRSVLAQVIGKCIGRISLKGGLFINLALFSPLVLSP